MTKALGMTSSKNGVKCVMSDTPPARPSLFAPVLLRVALHRRCRRVLDLEPVIDPAGAVRRAEPLRHDAFAAERAGMLEDDSAVAVIVPIEGYAVTLSVQQVG